MTRRKGMLLAALAATVLMAGPAWATPAFTLDTEAEFADAIGSGQVSALKETGHISWDALDPAFKQHMGTGEFRESRVWASGAGSYETVGGEQVALPAGMGMEWPKQDEPPEGSYIGGWVFQYGADPNLQNCLLQFDVIPPNIGANGIAINTVGIGLVDINGAMRSWTWGVGLAAGPGVLQSNWLNFVNVMVPMGAGAAGDARHGPLPGPYNLNNALYADNGYDPTKTMWIVGLENGAVPVGGAAPAPTPGGQYVRSPFNWWGVVGVKPVPEPVTMLSLFAGIGFLGRYARKRRIA